jgi:hypothetical protein
VLSWNWKKSLVSRITEMPDRHEDGIGRCIFCLDGKKKLTKEHIVLYGLSKKGQMFIRKGSCVECNNGMNERFENNVLQNDFLDVRAVLELERRKRKNQAPLKTHPVNVLGDDGLMHTVTLKPADHPGHVQWQVLSPAGLLVNEDRDKDGTLTSLAIWFADITPDRLKYRSIEYRIPNIAGAMPLTIAKAAYAFAIVELGLDAFDGSEIRDLLCGKRNDIYNFVGGLSVDEKFDTDSAFHRFYVRRRGELQTGELQTIVVHLFASFDAPPWEIVVGKAK